VLVIHEMCEAKAKQIQWVQLDGDKHIISPKMSKKMQIFILAGVYYLAGGGIKIMQLKLWKQL